MANFTKKALMASFSKLLNEKPFDKITVQDIVDDCGVIEIPFTTIFKIFICCWNVYCNKSVKKLKML